MIILGSEQLDSREDSLAVHSCVQNLAGNLKANVEDPEWKVFNVLHRNASQVAALDLGYKPGVSDLSGVKLLFMMGADTGQVTRDILPRDCTVVYVGSHGDSGASIADIVLPGAAFTEKS